MNEDELRAFLDSATVGDDEQNDEQNDDAATTPDGQIEGEQNENVQNQDDQNQRATVGPEATATERKPTFEELMGMSPDAPAAVPQDAMPPGDNPEIVPLVLPGPSARPAVPPRSAPQPPAAQPPVAQQPAPVAATPTPATPAQPPAASAASAQPPAAQAPAKSQPPVREPAAATAPLPLGIDDLLRDEPALPGAAATSATPQPTSTDDDYERIAVTGGEKKRFVPWIVAGAIAVVVLIAAVLIVLAVRGGDSDPAPTTPPTTEAPTDPTPTEDIDPPTEPTEPTEPEQPDPDEPPTVDVGSTSVMPVAGWGVEVDVSNRLGIMNYVLQGEDLLFTGGLLEQLPASCAKEPWGMTRVGDGTFEALKPETRCAAAPELHDEIWGLMAAMAASARPI